MQFPFCKTAAFSAAPPVKMPTIENSFHPSNSGLSHPPLLLQKNHAEALKQLLLMLSKRREYSDHRSTLRAAADRIRETAFGYNRSTTKKKILRLLNEFTCLELDDITDETGIAEHEIKAALTDLASEEKITVGKRRRWQEPGKHYNELFELKTQTIG